MLSELSPSSGSSSGNAMAEEPTVLSQWCRHDDESTEAMGLLCIASAQTSDLLACSCGSWLLLLPPGAPPGSPEAHMKQFTSSSARLAPNSLFIRPNCGLEERPLHAEPEVVRVWGRGPPEVCGCGLLGMFGPLFGPKVAERRIRMPSAKPLASAYICLGSNLGHRARHIGAALRELGKIGRVAAVSQLYQTAPQLVTEQPDFLNAACELHVAESLCPTELLHELKRIERSLGRDETGRRYGPRVIDLDIALLGDSSVDTPSSVGPLRIPHAAMAERSFVLKPLCDLDPGIRHPENGATVSELYSRLRAREADLTPPQRVLPVREDATWPLGARTYVMGILNVTPDSFSDGGVHYSQHAAVEAAAAMYAAGADVIDIGAESTRPGAARVSEEEELSRLVPVVRAIRNATSWPGTSRGRLGLSAAWGRHVPISVDTSRAAVAEAAVAAGADMVNDISAGALDGTMLETVAALDVPLVLMHTRGDAASMAARAIYADVRAELCDELRGRVGAAARAGIPPWHVVVDPGLGFAKTPEHSLDLLGAGLERFVSELVPSARTSDGRAGFACATVVGASRKGFIGRVLDEPDPRRRGWGNAAAVSAAVVARADVVRVHDVAEMKQVALMADAIHRRAPAAASE